MIFHRTIFDCAEPALSIQPHAHRKERDQPLSSKYRLADSSIMHECHQPIVVYAGRAFWHQSEIRIARRKNVRMCKCMSGSFTCLRNIAQVSLVCWQMEEVLCHLRVASVSPLCHSSRTIRFFGAKSCKCTHCARESTFTFISIALRNRMCLDCVRTRS